MPLRNWQSFLPRRGVVMGRPAERHSSDVTPTHTRLAFVTEGAEGPEADELLNKMIQAMGAAPADFEMLRIADNEEIPTIRAEVIVALGERASRKLLNTDSGIRELRGRFHAYGSAKIMPTYHPADLLKNPELKREAWADLQLVARELGITPAGKGR